MKGAIPIKMLCRRKNENGQKGNQVEQNFHTNHPTNQWPKYFENYPFKL